MKIDCYKKIWRLWSRIFSRLAPTLMLSILLVVGSACGSKNEESQVRLGPVGTPSDPSVRDQIKDKLSDEGKEIVEQVESLEKNLNAFLLNSGVAQVHRTLPALAQPVFRDKQGQPIDLSVDAPLIIGQNTLLASYGRIKTKIHEIPDVTVVNWLLEGAGGPFEPIEDDDISNERERKTLKVAQEILGLARGMERWLDALAHREHNMAEEKFDTRTFFKVQNSECPTNTVKRGRGLDIKHCLKDLLKYWERFESFPEERRLVKHSIISFCQQIEGRHYDCADAWEKMEKGGELEKFYLDVSAAFNEMMRERFFAVREQGPKFTCRQNQRSPTILLKLNIQTDDPVVERLARLGTAWYWNEKNVLRIVPVFQKEFSPGTQAIKVEFVRGNISHVNRDEPLTIRLAQRFKESGSMREGARTFAHELGHVFGLPDCYHQFIESETNDLVYYEIEQNNLMCSIQRNVRMTKRSIREMIRKRCDFD